MCAQCCVLHVLWPCVDERFAYTNERKRCVLVFFFLIFWLLHRIQSTFGWSVGRFSALAYHHKLKNVCVTHWTFIWILLRVNCVANIQLSQNNTWIEAILIESHILRCRILLEMRKSFMSFCNKRHFLSILKF